MPSRGDEVTRTRRTGYERDEQNARTHARTLCAGLSLLALVAAAAREPREPGLALRSLRPGEALLAGVAVASGRADVSGAPGSARVSRHARETCTTHTHTTHTVDKWPQSCDESSHRPRTCHPRGERVQPLRESNTL